MNENELKAHLAAIVDSSDDAIISKDLNGVVQSFNAAAERMFGYTAQEVIGRPVLMLIPAERRHEEPELLRRLRMGERIDHFETVRQRKDGRLIDVSLTVSPVRGADGRILGASKIARDITEQRRAARQLREQREWFRVTLDSIGDAVIACDRDGRITFLNHTAEGLTGWKREQAEGRPLEDVLHVVHEGTHESIEDLTLGVLVARRAATLSDPAILITRAGREWPIAHSAAPILDREGNALGVVLVFREILHFKQNEERMRNVAAERERLLQSERSSRNEAERANRVKDEFVAMVSHELRTPLNAILGWTQLLKQDGADAPTLAHGLDVITRNTRLQAQLIADLLDISRIMSGKLNLVLERVDLVEVVQSSVEALQGAVRAKGLELAVRVELELIPVAGDPARLQQIVLNLLSNAIKFTPAGGRVNVTARCVEAQAEVEVSDTGIGIDPVLLPDIFERFRQGSGTTTRRHGGLGLGLSISKHLAELHGGSVRAWSAGPNLGATFTLQVPRMPPAVAGGIHPDPDQFQADRHDSEPVALRGLRVLVVEDDQDTRDLVRRLLESHGAEVVVAASAPEALDLLPDARPTVLVSDIGLPDVDGYELIRRLRLREDWLAHIPAVALSAFARAEDKTRALRAGFNAHVAKPVEPSEFVATVGSFSNLVGDR